MKFNEWLEKEGFTEDGEKGDKNREKFLNELKAILGEIEYYTLMAANTIAYLAKKETESPEAIAMGFVFMGFQIAKYRDSEIERTVNETIK